MDNKHYAPHAWGTKAELLPLVGDLDGAAIAWSQELKAADALGTPGARLDALMNGVEIALKSHEQNEAARLLDQASRFAVAAGLGWSKPHLDRLERKMAGA